MSTTHAGGAQHASPATAAGLDVKLEVVVLPVADVERSKQFYAQLGWRVDADFAHGDTWRLVQMTPPGSPCSIMFGKGFTDAPAGSARGTFLVVDDLARARAALVARGVDVSEVFHFQDKLLQASGTAHRVTGPDPNGQSYFSFASFSDPDGNSWLVQEVGARLPGRGFSLDVPTLTMLLREAETAHGAHAANGPTHHWSAWYAAYIVARVHGSTSEDAAQRGAERIRDAT